MMFFWGAPGPKKSLKHPSVAGGFASRPYANFGLVLERGPGSPLDKRRSNDAGSVAEALDGKARATAYG